MSASRVLNGLGKLSSIDQDELNIRVLDVRPTQAEVGPSFHRVFGGSKRQGLRLAEAFAAGLPDADHHRQLFQQVAL